MKKVLLNIVVLFLVFVASVSVTGALINREKAVRIHNVESASLPIMYMEVSEVIVNPMYGYAKMMEQQYIRDSITPLSTNRMLNVVLEPLGNEIKSVKYEVSSADGTNMMETDELEKWEEKDGYLKTEFKIENPILMNQEYTLHFEVELKDGDVCHYYTRLLQRAGTNIEEYLEFVNMFYMRCMSSSNASDIISYLEPDASAVNDTYTSLNIHSSFEMISWGDMNVELVQKAYPVIKDMNETTCSVVMKYVISDKQEDADVDYYNVEDFYRMRYAQSRVMLLNFERETHEIFNGSDVEFTNNGINLGIIDKNVDYISNGNTVAFVPQGELWSFDRSTSKMTKIFSFRTGELDVRENLQEHDIKIVRVGESGDIDFVVYGYMNCDEHQGEVGIGVYHYDEELNQINEQLFIPVNTSYEYLENNMGILSYVTMDNLLYLLMENDLYKVDIANKTYTVIMENLLNGCYVVSKSQENIAWMNEMSENASTSITVMNLESGQTYQIQAGADEKIKALGFINEDFVYGLAKDSDIRPAETGENVFAMHTVKIAQFGGNVVKEYHQDGIWISGVNLELGLLELLRVKMENGFYVPTVSDHIMNNLQNQNEKVEIRQIYSQRKANQIALEFDKAVGSDKVLYLEANMVNVDETQKVDLGQVREDNELYYVYAQGNLDSTWTNVRDAILRADSQMGTVLNRRQQYVWERGNRDSIHLNNQIDIPPAVLSGTLDVETLANTLGEDYMVLNMTGCTLDQVLYQVGHGNPVIAKVSDSVTVVIVGYNVYNTILYYPATGEQGYYGIQDSTKLFQNAGNVFVGYMENVDALLARK